MLLWALRSLLMEWAPASGPGCRAFLQRQVLQHPPSQPIVFPFLPSLLLVAGFPHLPPSLSLSLSIFYQDCHFPSGCGGSPHFPAHTYLLTTPPGTAPLFSASRGGRYYNKQSMPLASVSPCIYAKRILGGGGNHFPSPKEGPQELSGCHPTSREEGGTVTKLEGAVDGFMCGPRVAKNTAVPPR